MSRLGVLKAIIAKHKYQLLLTNVLFAVEMLGPLLRPFFLGEAINDLIIHRYRGLIWLAGSQGLWLIVGTIRHRYDTRTYTAVYNSLVTRMMTKVKTAALSRLSAHANLAREAVDFLQYDLNYVVEAAYNLVGSLLLLFCVRKKAGGALPADADSGGADFVSVRTTDEATEPLKERRTGTAGRCH